MCKCGKIRARILLYFKLEDGSIDGFGSVQLEAISNCLKNLLSNGHLLRLEVPCTLQNKFEYHLPPTINDLL